ncbi:MAG: NADP-dependent isocitrate dehydrogenase, partial [Pseudomonadota bacterium]|nr:NADP-dependent isocitrate dehydrogenase [Pseudomonadota bacterium]
DLARARAGMKAFVKTHQSSKEIIQDLQELMPGATLVSCSGFGEAIINCME